MRDNRWPRSPLLLGTLLLCCAVGAQRPADTAGSKPAPPKPQLPDVIPAPNSDMQHTQVGATWGRPANLFYPANCSTGRTGSCPLIMILHAYASNGSYHARYLRVLDHAEEMGFATLLPDGTLNSAGARFWNGPSCCAPALEEREDVDDVGYLKSILTETQQLLNLDGIYVIGHSNGGNMASELACKTDLIDGLFSIAGFELPENCSPHHPVSATLVHGTLDNIVLYETSEQALRGWLALDQCPNTTSLRIMRDFDCDSGRAVGMRGYQDEWRDVNCNLPGNETVVTEYGPCKEGTRVGFWKMEAAGHVPSFNDAFTVSMLSTLFRDRVKKDGQAVTKEGGPRRRKLRA